MACKTHIAPEEIRCIAISVSNSIGIAIKALAEVEPSMPKSSMRILLKNDLDLLRCELISMF